jgi:hypothetical protein
LEDAVAVPTSVLAIYVTVVEPERSSDVRYDAVHGVIALPVYISDAGQ